MLLQRITHYVCTTRQIELYCEMLYTDYQYYECNYHILATFKTCKNSLKMA